MAKRRRKYSPSVSKDVEREMKAMKQGKLKSGRSGKTVTNPKQAIAIYPGLGDISVHPGRRCRLPGINAADGAAV